MAQRGNKPDLLDRFADGLERTSKRMKAAEQSPEFQRQQREAKIRAKWVLLCSAVAVPIFSLALWVSYLMGWSKNKIFLWALVFVTIGIIRTAGLAFANRKIKRDLR